jgi:cation transport protein ChaC
VPRATIAHINQEAHLKADPFVHLPGLRVGSRLRTSRSTVRHGSSCLVGRTCRKAGLPPNWRRSDERLEEIRRAALRGRDTSEDLWVYAYGSLMWDPGLLFEEVRLADAEGYQRRFTSKITIGRGSPKRPALMLSLHPHPGCCRGLAFRIAADLAEEESAILWRREMLFGGYSALLVPMSTPQGTITALVFAANTAHSSYVEELPLSETAYLIARGSGVMGTNREYLEQLASQLEALEIEDPYVHHCSSVCATSVVLKRIACAISWPRSSLRNGRPLTTRSTGRPRKRAAG